MRRRTIAAIGILLVLQAVPGSTQQVALILRPGIHLVQLPMGPPRSAWFGLYRMPSGFALRPATVTLTEVRHACAGSAVEIRAEGLDSPQFLLSAEGLRAGPVPTAAVAPGFLYPGQTQTWQLGRSTYWMAAFGKAIPIPGNTLFTGYQLVLGQGAHADTLVFPARFADDGTPEVLWAGDLDGDSRLDLIADLRTHYASHNFGIFLSRGTAPPHFVTLAADWQVPGC